MAVASSTQDMFVIATVNNRLFAVPIALVQGVVPMPKVTFVPGTPPFIRGVTNLRDSTVFVVDLRVRMGIISCVAERQNYIEQLNLREQEHRHWLEELETSVKESRPFSLPRDPHQCAFGKWYDNYEYNDTTHRSMALDHVLVKFKNPHDRIHAVAEQVLTLADAGRQDAALAVIEKTRNGVLMKMIELFEEARITLLEGSRELLMLISDGEKQVALTVDTVESVETVPPAATVATGDLQLGLNDPLFCAVSRRQKDDGMVFLLDVSEFFDTTGK